MSRTYRTVFIGCGHRGSAHAGGVAADSRYQVAALADIKPEAAEGLKAKHGWDKAAIYADYRQMLEKEKPDVAIACLWTPLHLPVVRDCMEAGVPIVLSEKPVAPTWGEYQEMARVAEKTGCQLTFCHQRRFAKGNQLARQLIAEGRFGKIERMDLYSPRHLLDCGTHTFDQALSFNGESPAKWVLGAVDVSETFAYFNVRAEIMAAGTLVFENGVRATIQVGGPDMDQGSGVRVIGSDGFIEVLWDGQLRRAVVYSDPSWQPPAWEETGMNAQMVGVLRDALDAYEAGREPELSYKKAVRAGEIIFAFYESVRRNARVELPLIGVTDNPFLTMRESGAFADTEKKREKV